MRRRDHAPRAPRRRPSRRRLVRRRGLLHQPGFGVCAERPRRRTHRRRRDGPARRLHGAHASGFFLYGVALIYGYAGSMQLERISEATHNNVGNQSMLLIGMGMLAVGLFFKIGAAPFQAWTPDVYQGAPTAVTAFMAACTKVAAFGALLRLFYVGFGADRWAGSHVLGHRDPHHARRRARRHRADRHEAAARLLRDRAHRVPADRHARRPERHRVRRRPGHLAPGGAVLPGDVRPRDGGWLRDPHPRARRVRRGRIVRQVGRARQALPAGGGDIRVPAAVDGGHPADRRLRRQVGGVHCGPVGGRLAGRAGRDRREHHLGVLLRAGDPGDVLQ